VRRATVAQYTTLRANGKGGVAWRYWVILKSGVRPIGPERGIFGAFHHISAQHMQRYLEEFDFRWNRRRMNDFERLVEAVAGTEGTRLYYRTPSFLVRAAKPS